LLPAIDHHSTVEMGIEPNPSNEGSFPSLVLSALSALADN